MESLNGVECEVLLLWMLLIGIAFNNGRISERATEMDSVCRFLAECYSCDINDPILAAINRACLFLLNYLRS